MFKTNFPGNNKICGVLPPNVPSWLRVCYTSFSC